MKLRLLKMAAFKNSTLATLQGAVNDFTSGKAVASATSGTVDYAASDVGERDLIDQQYFHDGTNHITVLFYAG
jgi:hypothetical protein